MTGQQQGNAELLRDLGQPAELIAINAELPLEIVKVWLKTGKWPVPDKQQVFGFDAGDQPREKPKPVTSLRSSHGLQQFACDPAGRPDANGHPGRGCTNE